MLKNAVSEFVKGWFLFLKAIFEDAKTCKEGEFLLYILYLCTVRNNKGVV